MTDHELVLPIAESIFPKYTSTYHINPASNVILLRLSTGYSLMYLIFWH